MDGNLGLRAEDAAPRGNAPRDSGRPERVRTRLEARLVGPALCRFLCNPAKEPTQASRSRLVRSALRQHVAILPASRSASNIIASRAASASLGTASASFFVVPASCDVVLPAGLELCPRVCIPEPRFSTISDRTSVCRGLHGTSGTFLWKRPGRCSRDRLWTTGAGSK